MTQLTIMLMLTAGLVTVLDWRKGLLVCVLVGVMQDPLRKVAPGQPLYYVLLVGVVFGIAWFRAALTGVPLAPSVIFGWRRNLKGPFAAFAAVVIAQAAHSYIRYGNAIVPGVGLLVWLAPVPAIMLSYQLAAKRGLGGVRLWMKVYIAATLVALCGVYLEYVGFESPLLGEIGEGQIIYDLGTVLKAHSGFFRASEIAAWHTAAVACFVFTLAVGKRPTVLRIVSALGLVALLVSLGFLTGRRKMLIEITIFISAYLFLVAWLQRGMWRLAMIVVMMGAISYVGIVGFVSPDLVQESYTKQMQFENAQQLEGYATRGQSAFVDLPHRVNITGWQPLVWSIENYGWLGAGLGSGSQGTNEIMSEHNINRWAAEGGLGKIAMELGIPGLIALLWLLRMLGHHFHEQLEPLAKISPKHARMAFGLLAFLLANVATFTVATQAYSDLFVLLILGWCIGFLFAMPMLGAQEAQRAQQSANNQMWRWSAPTQPASIFGQPPSAVMGRGQPRR
jgi:hypothetical protein